MPKKKQEKKLGVALIIWLVIMLIGNAATAILYFAFGSALLEMLPEYPLWTFYLLGALALVILFLTAMLFLWQKWAFYTICALAVFIFIFNLFLGVNVTSALMGLIGPIILYFLMKPQWKLFV